MDESRRKIKEGSIAIVILNHQSAYVPEAGTSADRSAIRTPKSAFKTAISTLRLLLDTIFHIILLVSHN